MGHLVWQAQLACRAREVNEVKRGHWAKKVCPELEVALVTKDPPELPD